MSSSSQGTVLPSRLREKRGEHAPSEEQFAAILADFKLPGLNDLELVKRIRAANRRVPIILMTAHGTAELAIEANKVGRVRLLAQAL